MRAASLRCGVCIQAGGESCSMVADAVETTSSPSDIDVEMKCILSQLIDEQRRRRAAENRLKRVQVCRICRVKDSSLR